MISSEALDKDPAAVWALLDATVGLCKIQPHLYGTAYCRFFNPQSE